MENNVLKNVLAQYKKNSTKKEKKEVDLTKYFNTILQKNQATGKVRFRILPPKPGESPFEEVYFHEMQIDGEWKKIYCPAKNDHDDCPLCEAEQILKSSGDKTQEDAAKQYKVRKFYIVKGIERGKEEEGVKFWRFKHNYKNEGILDKIIPLFEEDGDITDKMRGRDIVISMGKDDKGYTKVTSILSKEPTPLSTDEEQMNEWVNDEMKWTDVYSRKPEDFLRILAEGDVPVYDSSAGKYVSKSSGLRPSATNQNYSKKVEKSTNEDNDEEPF